MRRIPDHVLPDEVLAQLLAWQHEIDALPDFAARVDAAKTRFSSRSGRSNKTFRQVRAALKEMCAGARRCMYCEDSVADEVEHIKPKNFYPEAVFTWENYLYACGPCNGGKSDQYAVIDAATGAIMPLMRATGAPPLPPQAGEPVFLNPRTEAVEQLFFLDLLDTFFLLPDPGAPLALQQRTQYTIDVLKLNRESLPEARQEAYDSYRDRLEAYIRRRDLGDSAAKLQKRIDSLKKAAHPTVWHEMKRLHAQVPELNALFQEAPEALGW
ncbi:MAG: hypothetical protein KJ065_11500 [Anaerolineae bacterium]|nr:hypothetical protein [Anaerolineae bacterium]